VPGRIFRGVALVLAGALVLIGTELFLALRRDYIKKDPAGQIKGVFGQGSDPPLRFVVLGDSTSVGLGTTPDHSFPWVLAQRLGEHFKTELTVLGRSGAVTADVADLQTPQAVALKPDLVLIEIGANDATHATRITSVRTKMEKSLDALIATGATVVVAGPPDMGTSRAFAEPLRSLSGFNGRRVGRAIEAAAAARRLSFIELAQATAKYFEDEPQRHYGSDGFHPSAAGYARWADAMFPKLLKAAESARRSAAGPP